MTGHRSSRLLTGAALTAGLAWGTIGCGVPTRESPATVHSTAVPYGLLDRASTPTAPEPDDPAAANAPRAFYVNSADRLVGVPLDQSGKAAPLLTAIAALSAGPDRSSRGRGLGTAIPPGLTLEVTRLEKGVAVIDLGGELAPGGDQGPLAVAQIVLTATSVPTVDRVRLTWQGQPLEAQLPDRALTSTPLTARDYNALLAPPPA